VRLSRSVLVYVRSGGGTTLYCEVLPGARARRLSCAIKEGEEGTVYHSISVTDLPLQYNDRVEWRVYRSEKLEPTMVTDRTFVGTAYGTGAAARQDRTAHVHGDLVTVETAEGKHRAAIEMT
jgi:hypothetical protein